MPNAQTSEVEPVHSIESIESKIATMTRDERLIAYGGVTAKLTMMQQKPGFTRRIAIGDSFAAEFAANEREKAQLDAFIGDINRSTPQETDQH